MCCCSSYHNIWQKTRANWKYVHSQYVRDYDYFVFGGTDYYIAVENLRYYLQSEKLQAANEKTPLYLGRRLAEGGNMAKQFNSGGPSYVLNKLALGLFVSHIEEPACVPGLVGPWEDVMISKCLRESSNGAVLPYDTRDDKGRERFHPFTPGSHFNQRVENVTALKASGKKPGWFTSYSAWGLKTGYETHAPFSIGWHYIKPSYMHWMDKMLYGCRRLTASDASNLALFDSHKLYLRRNLALEAMEKRALRRQAEKPAFPLDR